MYQVSSLLHKFWLRYVKFNLQVKLLSQSSSQTQKFLLKNVLISRCIPSISLKIICIFEFLIQDSTLPFEMRRKQFPIKLAYSLTANKAQGQTLDFVGIYLGKEFFCHGQLYTAVSRVGDRSCLKILFKRQNEHHVKNIVFKEVL